jgi:WD40 repeat protein/serine/threonine protein kinase
MESEREQKTKELFKAALELPPEERGAFLDRACAGDEKLRFAVERLLAAAESPGISIGTSAMKLAARELAEEREQDESRRQLAADSLISHYRIVKPIGAGGMGTVYLAEDTHLHRQVAIKVLAEDFAANADRVRRFEREALTVSALKHPNILTIYEMLGHEDLRLIVTEFIEGETLRQVISCGAAERRQSAGGALDWREVVNIAAQIAAALNAAHAAGIFHRDIKPENVIRQADGHVKVLDFGVAKHIGQDESSNGTAAPASSAADHRIGQTEQTRTGQFFYTPGYASPEQARGDPQLKPDKRTDIFSLGVMMFEMLVGRRPFARATIEEEMAAVLAPDEAPDVREHCPDIPATLAALIAKAIRKDREQRYAAAGEMLAELQELRSQIEATDLERVQQSLKTQNANRLLSQFTVLYLKDRRVRLPLGRLVTVWLAANLPRGKPEKALLRKSVISILLKFGRRVLALAVVAAFVAFQSISEQWEARTLRDGHTKAVRRVAFSPDGQLLVTGSDDGLVIVWDFAGRRRLATIDDHKAGVLAVAFSPNGRHFATGADNASIIVWEVASQNEAPKQIESIRLQKVAELHGQNGSVAALVFSPNGEWLASVSHDQRIYDVHVGGQTIIWETKRWQKLRELPIGSIYGHLPFFLDNQRLMIRGEIWNVDSGKVVEDKLVNEWDGMAVLSPDGKLGVRLDGCCYVGFWRLFPPKQLRRHLAHQFIARAAAISYNGRWAATGAENIVFWDATTREPITSHKHKDNVWDLEFSPDDRWLVSTHGDGSVLVWDANERRLVTDFAGHSGNINSVDFAPDGKRFVTAGDDRSILLWNAATGLRESALNGHEVAVKKVKFRDNNTLVSEDILGDLFFWNIAQRRYENGCPQARRCKDVLVSPDEHWMVSSRQVVDLRRNRQALDFESAIGNGLNAGAAFSADGRWLAAIQSGTRKLFLWDTATWQVTTQTEVHEMDVIRMAFSPDGGKLALGGYQGEVALMNVHPFAPTAVLGRHLNHIQAIAFSPDGKLIASASDDATVGIWEVEKLGLAARLVHNAPVLSVAFSPDGGQLITAGQDETVRRYTPYRTLWGWRLD